MDTPLLCNDTGGGVIDPSGFRNDDGTRWITYKVDGNSFGGGGDCNNSPVNGTVVKTPIMLQQVAANGCGMIGGPTFLFQNDEEDGPLVEAPSLVKSRNGNYTIFFSSGCYSSDSYDVGYAMATSIAGPYTKYGPLMTTNSSSPAVLAPGGADINRSGTHLVFHGGAVPRRPMYVATVDIDSPVISN
jgi:beta-xylosidase